MLSSERRRVGKSDVGEIKKAHIMTSLYVLLKSVLIILRIIGSYGYVLNRIVT
jgi:hypothetical protein